MASPKTSGQPPRSHVANTFQTNLPPSQLPPDESKETPEATDSDTSLTPARTLTGPRWLALCAALYINAFLYGLDTTIAADVQGSVVATFSHVEQLAWIGAGFPLGAVAIVLLLTKLYHTFNMKHIYAASLLAFAAGSALCGAAPNMPALIVGRVVAGAGGEGTYLGNLNYFGAMTGPHERGLYMGLVGLFWGIGAVLGPVIGGAFSSSAATWRWAFYINLIIGAFAAPPLFAFLPAINHGAGTPVRDRLRRMDALGFLLQAALWAMFTIGFTMAGGQWPWRDGRTIASLVVFGALLASYIAQQYFCVLTTPETRSFPVYLLRSRTQVLLYIATSANITVLFVMVYFLPVYFQFVHDDTAILAAVRLLPFVVVFCTVNTLAGHLIARVDAYMPVYLVSGAVLTLSGALMMVYLSPDTSQGTIYGLSVLSAVGGGLTLQLGYTIATVVAPKRAMGDAISLQNISQIGSTVIALVIAGQVFQSTAVENLTAVLGGRGFSPEEIVEAVAGAQSEVFQRLTGELRAAAVAAVTNAIQKAMVLGIVAGGVLLVASLLMKRERIFTQKSVLE